MRGGALVQGQASEGNFLREGGSSQREFSLKSNTVSSNIHKQMNNQRINRVIVPVVIEIKVTYGCGHHLITAVYTLRSINKAGIKPKLGPSK